MGGFLKDMPNNKLVTFVLSYYNQPKNVLIRHLSLWNNYSSAIKNHLSFILIDDCSKIPVSELIDLNTHENIDLSIYSVKDDLFCNISGTRNLGAFLCNSPYLFILDMDTCVNSKLAYTVVSLAKFNSDKRNVFKFTRIVPSDKKHKKHKKPHPAVCLIRKSDYWNIGGCEEDLVGNYGYTDPCFWQRAKGKVKVHTFKKPYLLYYPDGECNIKRDGSRNKRIFKERCKKNNWSNDCLRFNWKKMY